MNPALLAIADLIIVIGLILSVYSLSVLGKSFSLIPQARKLVQTGPYRWVRHPLYISELISTLGVILSDFTILKMCVYPVLIACQIYRALQEERLLAAEFPEYREYCNRTHRFVPGLL